MREIKFRYRVQSPISKKIEMFHWTLKHMELFTTFHWTVLSRDQYTELKDKNKVEIYENDIVSKHGVKYYVKWITNGYKLCTLKCKNNEYICELSFQLDNIIVIGNIYKTHELLEEK